MRCGGGRAGRRAAQVIPTNRHALRQAGCRRSRRHRAADGRPLFKPGAAFGLGQPRLAPARIAAEPARSPLGGIRLSANRGWRLAAVMSDNGSEFGGCEFCHTVTADQRQRRTPPRRSPHSWQHLRERHRQGQAVVLRHGRMCGQISERGQRCGTSSSAAGVVSHPTARCARPRPQPPVSSQLPA